jgi:hypothetical protein
LELNTNMQRAWLNIVELQSQLIKSKEQELMDFQRDQLLHGKDSKGETLQPYQSTMYAAEKNARNPLPGKWNPDLKDTGSFHNQMFATPKFKGDKTTDVKVSSKDSKTHSLVKKYSGLRIPGTIR